MAAFQKFKQTLDVAASVACIVICGIVAAGMLHKYISGRAQPGTAALARQVDLGLQIGDAFPAISGVDYRAYKKTIVLFVDSNCVHCINSLPAYRSLLRATASKKDQDHVPIAILGALKSRIDLERFNALGFSIPSKIDIDFANYRIRATPTVIVVNHDGRIENFWIGELSPNASRALTDLIEKTN